MAVTAFAPASIANLNVGFDLLGLALQPVNGSLLGDTVSVSSSEDQQNRLTIKGAFSKACPTDKDNIVWSCLEDFNTMLKNRDLTPTSLHLTLSKQMPIGSGLGSSACSIVAALVALNHYYHNPLNKDELLELMGQQEKKISGSLHYDNVAASFLGNLQVIVTDNSNSNQGISQSLSIPNDWLFVLAYSGLSVSTKNARAILPKTYPLTTFTQQTKKLAAFILGLLTNKTTQTIDALEDLIAEPYRKSLLPCFDQAKQSLLSAGAKTVGISGSGPTLFALFTDQQIAKQSALWLKKHYLQTNEGFVHLCKPHPKGAYCY